MNSSGQNYFLPNGYFKRVRNRQVYLRLYSYLIKVLIIMHEDYAKKKIVSFISIWKSSRRSVLVYSNPLFSLLC